MSGMSTVSVCRCGALSGGPGFCRHCDRAPVSKGSCEASCRRCAERDSYCAVCHRWQGSPGAARSHERACRAVESRNGVTR